MNVGTMLGFQNPSQWRRDWAELYRETLDFAVTTEQLGFDEIWLTEHHFTDDGYCPALMPVAAAIAARTSLIRIGTKVLLMPFHNPVRLAEDAAVVDLLSRGRLDLGVAAGYRREEFAGFGIPVEERSARTREGLEVLAMALRDAPFSFEGRFHSLRSVHVQPPAVQQPVPIWVGARSERPLRRAARHGYHLQLSDFDPDSCAIDYAIYVEALEAHGRDPQDFNVAAVATVFVDDDPERARAVAAPHMTYQQRQYERWFQAAGDRPNRVSKASREATELPPGCLVGTPEQVLDQIVEAHRIVPFTHFSFWALLPGMDVAAATRSLELFAARVLPRLRALGETSPRTR